MSVNEERWIEVWERNRVFEADAKPGAPKFFVTFPIPYMNGPVHLGHAYTLSRADAIARYYRLRGYNVLFPQGWHWTGQPIVSAAERLAKGDQSMVREFKEIDKVPDEIIEKFKDPVFMAKYYTERNRESFRRLGASIDWRREFHTTADDPWFSKFIEWQYLTLRELGYVTQGSHPVVWCPKDRSPVGDHDRLKGEGVYPVEFRIVLFKLADSEEYLAAATLRPETIFGTTNIWLSPSLEYVRARVNGKVWIVGKEAIKKLRDQLFEVEELGPADPSGIIGREAIVPIVGKRVKVLPASFIDKDIGTAVVYSVPAHAPYDYLALRDLQRSGNPDAAGIEPISIIEVKGYGDFPAVEIVERMKIRDQADPRAEEATKEIYSAELREGRMKGNCGEFSGLSVAAARKLVFDRLSELGLGYTFWELPEPVICRCTTRCHVKILENQWFLRYSDERWKGLARECIGSMKISPEEARRWFLDVVDWLRDYPCARQSGLGTPLPWDREWLVETLSDSTVYMAFYTIAHLIRRIDPSRLSTDLFDYVFYGKGDPQAIARSAGVGPELLEEMRKEFLYWYPVDLRVSAKELVPNHLTFFIFHHVALFDRNRWPRSISVNGMLTVEGEKMSKSKGNVITIDEAVKSYGADAVRLTLLTSSEHMSDANWSAQVASSIRDRISSVLKLVGDMLSSSEDREDGVYDRWMLNRVSEYSERISRSLESYEVKDAAVAAFYEFDQKVREYMKMVKGRPSRAVAEQVVGAWAAFLAPFAPFLAEELNTMAGRGPSVLMSRWPEPKELDMEAELEVRLVSGLINDIKEVVKALKARPRSIVIYAYTAESSQEFLRSPPPDKRGKLVKVMREMDPLIRDMLGKFSEVEVYRKHLDYISSEVGVQVQVRAFNEAPPEHAQRASLAMPGKPAIAVER